MPYCIKVIKKAAKDLDMIKGRDFVLIRTKILQLSENPRPFGCSKLTNDEGYRVRSGDFRILYRIDEPNKQVIVYRIKHRREVYR